MLELIASHDDWFQGRQRASWTRRATFALLISATCAVAHAATLPHSIPFTHQDDPAAEFQELKAKYLDVGRASERPQLLEAMLQHASDHRESRQPLQATLEAGWTQSVEALASPSVEKSFAALRKSRAAVDELRSSLMAIVQDDQLYPYPFREPDATSEQSSTYFASQRKIEKAQSKLAKLWKKSPKVKLPSSVRIAFETMDLTLATSAQLMDEYRMELDLSLEGMPAWAFGLPRPGEVRKDVVTLASFGLNYEEGLMLAESREVASLNDRYRDAAIKAEKDKRQRKVIEDTFDQVVETNRYRELLGLRALAWDPRLQAACDQHATYILQSDDFGHFQPDPEFKDFMVRAKRAGYSSMVYENCQKGATKPKEAHVALTRSTEHHRNMVRSDIYEMATAKAVRIWVQNFGQETGFRERLKMGAWWKNESIAKAAKAVR